MTHAPTSDAALAAAEEIALLRRQLERERRARRTAEQVGEQSTAQLYDAIQDLERAQDQLRRHLEDQTLINEISRTLREDLDPEGIVRRAVRAIGGAVGDAVDPGAASAVEAYNELWAGGACDTAGAVGTAIALALFYATVYREQGTVDDQVVLYHDAYASGMITVGVFLGLALIVGVADLAGRARSGSQTPFGGDD